MASILNLFEANDSGIGVFEALAEHGLLEHDDEQSNAEAN
jgi:hypothetical protein